MKRTLGFALPLLLTAGSASAYDWQGGKWARDKMPIPFQVSNELSEDVPDRDCLQSIQDGYNVWTALPCSYMRWEFTGRTPNDAWGASDGVNISSWRDAAWDQPSRTARAFTNASHGVAFANTRPGTLSFT